MGNIPNLKDIVLRDTPFADLMNRRVFNILLLATKYDAFMLEEDGRVDEEMFNEYTHLGLRYPPRFAQASTLEEAEKMLSERNFELIIEMPNMDNIDLTANARSIKEKWPQIPIVLLTPFSKEVSKRVAREDLSCVEYVFSWLGDSELLLAIVKLMEDKWNAPHDCASVGVQIILLVEDSVRFYSSALTHLFRYVLEQSQYFAKEALNDQLRTMRMRGRPKVMLARSYEEALGIYNLYQENILGIVSDMSFAKGGKKEEQAGLALGQYIRRIDEHLPIILESSEDENASVAEKLDADFISKNSKTYPQDLRQAVRKNFGFGDFIIQNPETGEELMRMKSLKDLQHHVFEIPDDAMRYHLTKNHFSRFFFTRAMFPPAVILKEVSVQEYVDMNEARQLVFDLIMSYRRMKNEGVVAIYSRDMFDEYSYFARIGKGSLGGKGRGLAFMGTMVKRYPKLESKNLGVNIPKTVVVCTDVFDEFMEQNDLYPIALSEASDDEILQAFLNARLPLQVREDLAFYFNTQHSAVAVRSSSILEDAHYQPFAGVYSTYMVPVDPNNKDISLERLLKAIKGVYASVFFHDSKAYLTATQNLIDQEKMAVVLQEVVGDIHETLYYPTLSGVARSLNFYPVGEEKAEEGIASIAFGLGKYIVDGGLTLKFSPKHPRHILQLSTTDFALRETQRNFYALDMENEVNEFDIHEDFNLKKVSIKDAPLDSTLKYVVSTYDRDSDMIWDGYFPHGRRIISFANLLQNDSLPLAPTISRLLEIGQKEIGRPVEIEFAVNVNPETGTGTFYLLQIRPIVDNKERIEEDLGIIDSNNTIISSTKVLGNGIVNDVYDVVYVKSELFDATNNPRIAEEIVKINEKLLSEDRNYILVGPGRWGSSDPWLGIPVKWAHISGAKVIVECGLQNYQVDPSQGTHFFQNLTSLGTGYFTINPFRGDGSFDEDYLNSLPAEEETEFVRLVHREKPFVIKMDGRKSIGVVMK